MYLYVIEDFKEGAKPSITSSSLLRVDEFVFNRRLCYYNTFEPKNSSPFQNDRRMVVLPTYTAALESNDNLHPLSNPTISNQYVKETRLFERFIFEFFLIKSNILYTFT